MGIEFFELELRLERSEMLQFDDFRKQILFKLATNETPKINPALELLKRPEMRKSSTQ